jgi:hypothetical protein
MQSSSSTKQKHLDDIFSHYCNHFFKICVCVCKSNFLELFIVCLQCENIICRTTFKATTNTIYVTKRRESQKPPIYKNGFFLCMSFIISEMLVCVSNDRSISSIVLSYAKQMADLTSLAFVLSGLAF